MNLLTDWVPTLTLIFGGCCSNALTLEQLTSQYPHSGSLITFAQFLAISLYGLPKFIVFTPYPRLRPRRTPLAPYLLQVALFYGVSLLNNAAFAYRIPMTVHIIFRSGGLVVNMIMGWLLRGQKSSFQQVLSVILVTGGVVLTTLSASKPAPKSRLSTADTNVDHTKTYAFGIGLLTLALVLSGLLGIVQDSAKAKYRTHEPTPPAGEDKKAPASWQESMFYLHLLSMPMFFSVRHDLAAQLAALSASQTVELAIPSVSPALLRNSSFAASKAPQPLMTFTLPNAYVALLLNTVTQVFCVAGVHRLTARVSSLTVTFVLAVRKAVSLLISVFYGTGAKGGENQMMLWAGAACVFGGSVLYTYASRQPPPKADEKVKSE